MLSNICNFCWRSLQLDEFRASNYNCLLHLMHRGWEAVMEPEHRPPDGFANGYSRSLSPFAARIGAMPLVTARDHFGLHPFSLPYPASTLALRLAFSSLFIASLLPSRELSPTASSRLVRISSGCCPRKAADPEHVTAHLSKRGRSQPPQLKHWMLSVTGWRVGTAEPIVHQCTIPSQ